MTDDELLLIVLTDIHPDQEEAWNRWYDEIHLPHMLEQPQVRWAARYDVVSDRHSMDVPYRYASVQAFSSLDSFQDYRSSPAFPRIRDEYISAFGNVSELGRLVLEKRPFWRGRE